MEKQPAVRVSRLSTFAFLYCAGMHGTLLTGLSAAGLLGVAVDKVTRCVAIPALSAVREWHGQTGVSCAAKSSVSFLTQKGLLYMGFAQYSSPFYILKPRGHRRALPFFASATQQKACPPRGCFRRKSARQLPFPSAPLP